MRLPHVVALALVAGCVDAGRPFTRGSRASVERARAEAEAAEARRVAALPRVPADQQQGHRTFGEEGGASHEAVGPLRFDRRGPALTAAEDVPERPIVFARKAARGWVFVTDRDEVYVSPTFTGRLRAVRTLGCPAPAAPPAVQGAPRVRGTAATRAAEAAMAEALLGRRPVDDTLRLRRTDEPSSRVWRSSGRAAFSLRGRALWSDGASLREAGAPDVVALAWKDETHGARVIAHRGLEVTLDGGATWREVPLGGALPLGVEGEAGALHAVTTRGVLLVRDDGSTEPATGFAPAAPARTACDPGCPAEAQARFARGYARVAPARAECVEEAAREPWEMARVVAHLPTAGPPDTMPEWVVPRGRSSPLGTARSRAFVDTRAVPAVVSAVRPDDPARGHPIALAWRGGDGRGAFTARVATTAPRETPVTSAWRLVAATRTGLVVEAERLLERTPEDEQTARALYWFGAAGARRLEASPGERDKVLAMALDDGGALVVTAPDWEPISPNLCAGVRSFEPPGFAIAVRLDPTGAVVARRDVVTGGGCHPVLGFGQRGDRWGVAVSDGRELTLLPFDGGEVAFGAWAMEGEPAACRAPAVDRLHLITGASEGEDLLPVTIGPQGDGPDFALARLVTLERAGERVCVRRLWGVQHLYDTSDGDGEDVGELYGAARFEARGDGLAGVFDDGRRVAPVSVSLSGRVGFMQDI
ncbi:MAG: hypothetical protein U0324_02060 [Polyangiales bacterium]